MTLNKISKAVLNITLILLISCNNSSNESLPNFSRLSLNTDTANETSEYLNRETINTKSQTIPTISYLETKSGKFGMVDNHGNLLVDTIYNGNWPASLDLEKGQAMFKKGEGFDYLLINYKNEIIIDLTGYSDHPCLLIRDKIPVRDEKTGMSGYLGKGGVVMIPFKFEYTRSFEKKLPLAPACINGKWGVIDEGGNWILQPRYNHIHEILSENSFIVILKEGGDYYYVDKNGKVSGNAEVGC